MIRLHMIKNNKISDISELVEKITWSGKKFKAPRSLSVSLMDSKEGYHVASGIANGDAVIFYWNDIELFRGMVFNKGRGKKQILSITAHDLLLSLVRNRDSYVFEKLSATGMMKRICNDFKIPIGSIADTGYIIPSQASRNKMLYDMILKALDSTYKATGERYYMRSKEGKIDLINRSESIRQWVLEQGVNLIDFNYSSSIEEMATRVKLESGTETAPIIATAQNDELINKFGVLQHYEVISEEVTKAKLQQLADKSLELNSQESETFDLDALGITDVISGSAVYVAIPEININRGYYIDQDTHTFIGDSHTMRVILTKTDKLPEVDM